MSQLYRLYFSYLICLIIDCLPASIGEAVPPWPVLYNIVVSSGSVQRVCRDWGKCWQPAGGREGGREGRGSQQVLSCRRCLMAIAYQRGMQAPARRKKNQYKEKAKLWLKAWNVWYDDSSFSSNFSTDYTLVPSTASQQSQWKFGRVGIEVSICKML